MDDDSFEVKSVCPLRLMHKIFFQGFNFKIKNDIILCFEIYIIDGWSSHSARTNKVIIETKILS